MWDLFFVSVLAGALFLYVPGFVLIRSFGVPCVVALVCAPIVSSVAYSVLSIAYSKLGVSCSWFSLVVPLLIISLGVFVLARLVVKLPDITLGIGDCEGSSTKLVGRHFNELCLALYVMVGLVLAAWFFLSSLENAGSFSQEYDNVHHLGLTRGFLESGDWSSLSSSLYMVPEDAAINPLPGQGFYPAAWNVLVALIASALNVPVAVAANALNYLFAAAVLPSSMFLLMRSVFKDRPTIVPFGALCALGFTAYPWGFLVFGPLYPNMIAFAVMPAVAFCFVALFHEDLGNGSRAALAVLFALGLVALALMQPNAAFSLGVLLAPFCVYRAILLAGRISLSGKRRIAVQVLAAIATLAAIAALWYAVYRAPFLQSVVTHWWPSFEPFSQSFLHALTLSFQTDAPQLVLAALVVVGGAYTLHDRRYLWMTCAYAFSCALYMVDASMDGPLKFLLTGFWFTDANRIAAFASLFAIPLASIGLWLLSRGIAYAGLLIAGDSRSTSLRVPLAILSSLVVSLAFVFANYCHDGMGARVPADPTSAFEAVTNGFRQAYGEVGPQVYDDDEKTFVKEVEQTVPNNALIVNMPDDGSVFSYGVDGARIYYRYLRTYGGSDETEASKAIRNRLDRIEDDPTVQNAVKSIGAQYVMLLDQGPELTPRRYLFTYEGGKNWRGMNSINDDTPGFEVVLAKDDMRLYRITAI